jgi:uncharacterized protein (DUF302 family)
MNDNGLVTLESRHSVSETINRLARIVVEKGLTIFVRIDHSGNAQAAGLELRPTEVIIFGNPRAGTPLMQESQTSGIDLPVRAVAWEDHDGKVWLTYNDANWIAARHGIVEAKAVVTAIENGLSLVCKYAAQASP